MDLVGTWDLHRCVELDAEGRVLGEPYGPGPIGQLSYSTDGRMSAVLGRAARTTAAANIVPSAAADGITTYGCTAYAGTWKQLPGDVVHHDVTVSLVPQWQGGTQVRQARVEDCYLVLRAASDHGHVVDLWWQRVATGGA